MKGDFIAQFFNKEPSLLTLEDISTFFSTKQEESGTLEFKSGDVEINDVFKEITAFLNTEGGLLIIGAPKESKEQIGKRILTYCIGDITFSKFLSKGWLQQKIFSNITPSPTNIQITEITTPNGNIFILDIPQSVSPPHQSNSDGRYYIRIDNEAKPAPHGLVQALFDKRKKPKLHAEVSRKATSPEYDKITVIIQNDSNIPADKVSFIIDAINVKTVTSEFRFEKINDEAFGIKFSLSNSTSQVLVSVISIRIEFEILHKSQDYIISAGYWCLQTDFDCSFFQISPNLNTVISKHWLDEELNLVTAVKNIRDNKS